MKEGAAGTGADFVDVGFFFGEQRDEEGAGVGLARLEGGAEVLARWSPSSASRLTASSFAFALLCSDVQPCFSFLWRMRPDGSE